MLIADYHAQQGQADVAVFQEWGAGMQEVRPHSRPIPGSSHSGLAGPPHQHLPTGRASGPDTGIDLSGGMPPIIAQAKALQSTRGTQKVGDPFGPQGGNVESSDAVPSGPAQSSSPSPERAEYVSQASSASSQTRDHELAARIEPGLRHLSSTEAAGSADADQVGRAGKHSDLRSGGDSTVPAGTTHDNGLTPHSKDAQNEQSRLTPEEAETTHDEAEKQWHDERKERTRQRKERMCAFLKANVPGEGLFDLFHMLVSEDKEQVDDALLQHIAQAIKVGSRCKQQPLSNIQMMCR